MNVDENGDINDEQVNEYKAHFVKTNDKVKIPSQTEKYISVFLALHLQRHAQLHGIRRTWNFLEML